MLLLPRNSKFCISKRFKRAVLVSLSYFLESSTVVCSLLVIPVFFLADPLWVKFVSSLNLYGISFPATHKKKRKTRRNSFGFYLRFESFLLDLTIYSFLHAPISRTPACFVGKIPSFLSNGRA